MAAKPKKKEGKKEQIARLTEELRIAREACQRGNTWVKVTDEETGEVHFVNALDPSEVQAPKPDNYVEDIARVRDDAKEAVRLRIEAKRDAARIRELETEVRGLAAARDTRDRRIEQLLGKLEEAAEAMNGMTMSREAVLQRFHEAETRLEAMVLELTTQLTDTGAQLFASEKKNKEDTQAHLEETKQLRSERDSLQEWRNNFQPDMDRMQSEVDTIQRDMNYACEMWPEDTLLPTTLLPYVSPEVLEARKKMSAVEADRVGEITRARLMRGADPRLPNDGSAAVVPVAGDATADGGTEGAVERRAKEEEDSADPPASHSDDEVVQIPRRRASRGKPPRTGSFGGRAGSTPATTSSEGAYYRLVQLPSPRIATSEAGESKETRAASSANRAVDVGERDFSGSESDSDADAAPARRPTSRTGSIRAQGGGQEETTVSLEGDPEAPPAPASGRGTPPVAEWLGIQVDEGFGKVLRDGAVTVVLGTAPLEGAGATPFRQLPPYLFTCSAAVQDVATAEAAPSRGTPAPPAFRSAAWKQEGPVAVFEQGVGAAQARDLVRQWRVPAAKEDIEYDGELLRLAPRAAAVEIDAARALMGVQELLAECSAALATTEAEQDDAVARIDADTRKIVQRKENDQAAVHNGETAVKNAEENVQLLERGIVEAKEVIQHAEAAAREADEAAADEAAAAVDAAKEKLRVGETKLAEARRVLAEAEEVQPGLRSQLDASAAAHRAVEARASEIRRRRALTADMRKAMDNNITWVYSRRGRTVARVQATNDAMLALRRELRASPSVLEELDADERSLRELAVAAAERVKLAENDLERLQLEREAEEVNKTVVLGVEEIGEAREAEQRRVAMLRRSRVATAESAVATCVAEASEALSVRDAAQRVWNAFNDLTGAPLPGIGAQDDHSDDLVAAAAAMSGADSSDAEKVSARTYEGAQLAVSLWSSHTAARVASDTVGAAVSSPSMEGEQEAAAAPAPSGVQPPAAQALKRTATAPVSVTRPSAASASSALSASRGVDSLVGSWGAEQAARLRAAAVARRAARLQRTHQFASGDTSRALAQRVQHLEVKLKAAERAAAAAVSGAEAEMQQTTDAYEESLTFLKAQVLEWKEAVDTTKEKYEKALEDERLQSGEREKRLREMLEVAEAESNRRKGWIETLKEETREREARRAVEDALRDEELKQRADERVRLMGAIKMWTADAERHKAWVSSLIQDVEKLKSEAEAHDRMHKAYVKEAEEEQRRLKFELWRRDETGRVLRTDVDHAVLFFAETMAALAGATYEHNQRLARNGALRFLSGLVHAERPEVTAQATRALGRMAWNGDADRAVISTMARERWSAWVDNLSKEVMGERGAPNAPEGSDARERARQLYVRETSSLGFVARDELPTAAAEGEATDAAAAQRRASGRPVPRRRLTGEGLREEDAADRVLPLGGIAEDGEDDPVQTVHSYHQQVLGSDADALHQIVELLHRDQQPAVHAGACDALSILSLTDENRDRLAAIPELVPRLLEVLTNSSDPETIRFASTAVGNIAYAHGPNAELVGDCGGVEVLSDVLRTGLKWTLEDHEGGLPPDDDGRKSPKSDGSGSDDDDQVLAVGDDVVADLDGASEAESKAKEAESRTGAAKPLKLVDIDALESVTAALATITGVSDKNVVRLGQCGGLYALVDITISAASAESEVVHANAAQALANATRLASRNNADLLRKHRRGFAPFVLLCGSNHLSVQRHAALAIGNIAQDDVNRLAAGEVGAVEALFLLTTVPDDDVQANALWALSNLAWSTENQERIGRFYDQLLERCANTVMPVQGQAVTTLANSLFYHNTNRRRLLDHPMGLRVTLDLCVHEDPFVASHACRAIGCAAADDLVALEIGKGGGIGPVVEAARSPVAAVGRYAAFALANLAVNDYNKGVIVRSGGVEALVKLVGHDDLEVRQQAKEAMEVMGDLPTVEELEDRRADFDLPSLLKLCAAQRSSVAAMGFDSVSEEVEKGGAAVQTAVAQHGGLEMMLNIIERRTSAVISAEATLEEAAASGVDVKARRAVGGAHDSSDPELLEGADADVHVLVRCLWALRSVLYGHEPNKEAWGAAGVRAVLRAATVQRAEAQEAAIGVLTVACTDHQQNSRALLRDSDGLANVITIAEGRGAVPPQDTMIALSEFEEVGPGSSLVDRSTAGASKAEAPSSIDTGVGPARTRTESAAPKVPPAAAANAALALELLQIVGPFNFIECANCGHKEAGGRFCSKCGHRTGFLHGK